jgi:hypothetical protein
MDGLTKFYLIELGRPIGETPRTPNRARGKRAHMLKRAVAAGAGTVRGAHSGPPHARLVGLSRRGAGSRYSRRRLLAARRRRHAQWGAAGRRGRRDPAQLHRWPLLRGFPLPDRTFARTRRDRFTQARELSADNFCPDQPTAFHFSLFACGPRVLRADSRSACAAHSARPRRSSRWRSRPPRSARGSARWARSSTHSLTAGSASPRTTGGRGQTSGELRRTALRPRTCSVSRTRPTGSLATSRPVCTSRPTAGVAGSRASA